MSKESESERVEVPRGRTGEVVASLEASLAGAEGSYRVNKITMDLLEEAKLRLRRDMINSGLPDLYRVTIERVD